MSAKKFYLTTPIYYVNARPHIGHAYTTIVADVLARRHRLLGEDTYFLTGTDEHGQKIERSAAAAGVPPQQFADEVAAAFQKLWDRMGITYDQFIRTTSDKHKLGVQKLFSKLYEKGHIYLDSYTGSYCVSDEAFVDAPVGTPCPDCGRLLEEVTEENFFFRLSNFQKPLIDLIESNELVITPESSRNEVLSFLRGNFMPIFAELPKAWVGDKPITIDEMFKHARESHGALRSSLGHHYLPGTLKDLSISRSGFKWGIPVPEPAASAAEQKHVIYVWLDALANYMSAVGYGDESAKGQANFARYWPADLHLVGKEITRFHCVYWPAFLLALNPEYQTETQDKGIVDVLRAAEAPLHLRKSKIEPQKLTAEQHSAWAREFLPKQVTAHGWLLFDNAKMSKSKGNIVRTETILDAFGDEVYGKQFPESMKAERDLFASDVLRYFLLREIPFGQDGSFSFEAMITRYNADLANGFGNLVSRVLTMIGKYFDGVVPPFAETVFDVMITTDVGSNMLEVVTVGKGEIASEMENAIATGNLKGSSFQRALVSRQDSIDAAIWYFDHLRPDRAITATYMLIDAADKHLSDRTPWKLAKSNAPEDLKTLSDMMYSAGESIRIITALLYPILPYATAKVWAQLGLGDIELAARNGGLNNLQWGGLKPGTKLGPLAPIFPRADKGLIQIMTDMEDAQDSKLASSKLSAQQDPAPPASTHPAAGPRSSTIAEPAGPLPVGGSRALTPGPDPALTTESGQLTPPAAETAPQITIDDFAKVELRVAQIVVAERIPKADKLLRLEVDLGPHGKRQILSGIAEFYTPEELVGRRIVVITNLAPRKMRGLESHGMLLAASDTEGGKPALATCGEEIALGARLK